MTIRRVTCALGIVLLGGCGTLSETQRADLCYDAMRKVYSASNSIKGLLVWHDALVGGRTEATLGDVAPLFEGYTNDDGSPYLPKCPSGGRYTVDYLFTGKGSTITVRCSVHGNLEEVGEKWMERHPHRLNSV